MLQNSHHAAQREKVGERVAQVFSLLFFFCCFYACFQFPNQTFNACPQCNNSLDFHYLDVTLINLLIILCFFYFHFLFCLFLALQTAACQLQQVQLRTLSDFFASFCFYYFFILPRIPRCVYAYVCVLLLLPHLVLCSTFLW